MIDIRKTLLEALEDPGHGWSMGSFGAIAEFHRDAGEDTGILRDGIVATSRGAIRLEAPERIHPVAFETLSPRVHRWGQSVALCLPEAEARRAARRVLTRLGADTRAIRPMHRKAVLYDMGLGLPQVDFCIRTEDPALIAQLDAAVGRSVLDPANPAMGAILRAHPHRVALTNIGRVEVFQKIGGPDTGGVSPAGPHTHVLPRLIASGRTHSANQPIPAGLVPCGGLHPDSPVSDAIGADRPFDTTLFARFETLLEAWGPEGYLDTKRRVWRALEAGVAPEDFPAPASRQGRVALRNALRQHAAKGGDGALLQGWRARFDRGEPEEDSTEPLAQGH